MLPWGKPGGRVPYFSRRYKFLALPRPPATPRVGVDELVDDELVDGAGLRPALPIWACTRTRSGRRIRYRARLLLHGVAAVSTFSPSGFIVLNTNLVRRTLDIDADTDARLREMATERGQDVSAVLAEAVALLDSVVDIAGPDIAEDRRRLDDFMTTRLAVPLDDVKTWVASWGSANELPRPVPRKIG
jgi:predicted transcriptional regulator